MAKKKKATNTKGLKGTAKLTPGLAETAAAGPEATSVAQRLTSYDVFEFCVQRARNLVKLHEAAHGKAGKPEKYTADAHRAAIVLAVAALDAFVRDFVVSRVRTLLTKKDQLPSALSEHIKKLIKDDDLLEAARKGDLLDRVEKAFRGDFAKRSFQGTHNIEECLRIAGYEDVFHQVAINAHMNEDKLRTDLNAVTERRHAIAHRGDYDMSENPPREKVVTKAYVKDCIKLVCIIAKQMHELGSQS